MAFLVLVYEVCKVLFVPARSESVVTNVEINCDIALGVVVSNLIVTLITT